MKYKTYQFTWKFIIHFQELFIAGSESSSTTVEWAMEELMKNPKVMEKAQAEVRRIYNEKGYVDESEIHQLKYLNSIEEILSLGMKLRPSSQRDFWIIDFGGTNFEFEYIPFDAGRRMCPGVNFAIPNIELPLANLLYHFGWKLPNGFTHEEFDMSELFGAHFKNKGESLVNPY
ncbi:hypothetical protein K1719_012472 [Acacia pycnantha]|nr:hypothetical protein K1719_012472 [Acacia pycnantha]